VGVGGGGGVRHWRGSGVTMSGGWRDSRVNVVDKIELTNNVLITPTMFMFICAR